MYTADIVLQYRSGCISFVVGSIVTDSTHNSAVRADGDRGYDVVGFPLLVLRYYAAVGYRVVWAVCSIFDAITKAFVSNVS
jgi:hypothetical protein